MRMISSRRRPLKVFAWMNQTQSPLRRHACLLLFLSVCLLTALLGMQGTAVFAQSIQQPIQIVKIDAGSFPAVQVFALLHDRSGKPIPTANLGNLTMTEKVLDQEEVVSDDLHQFTLNTISTGAEVLFVIDVSGDLTKPGASRDSEWVEMQNVVKFFIDTLQIEDKAGLLIVKGSQVDYLQPLTGDKALLTQSLRMIPQKAESISFGRDGIERALFDFSISPNHLNTAQAVVFITPQLFHGEAGLDEIITKAIDAQIQVHCVLTRDIEYTDASEPLIYLATETGGTYVYYKELTSPQPIFDAVNEQRTQTLLSFRSKLSQSSERTVEISLQDALGTFAAAQTYQVTLQPPAVMVLSPALDDQIIRQAASSEVDLETVEPTTLLVSASINWADGFPREIASAQLEIDGSPVTKNFKLNPEGISFDWDLRSYQEPGKYPARLSILVQDELGMTGKSDETTVQVVVSVPEPALTATGKPLEATATPRATTVTAQTPSVTQAPALCADLTGLEAALCRGGALGKMLLTTPSGWVTIGGLLFALFAIVMAFRFRGPISQAGDKALGTLLETVTQLRRLPQSESEAFLQVLGGDDELLGKNIPLYPEQATTLGRSPREVELVFQINQERSVVSRKHCEIRGTKGRFKVIDLGSTHGTYLNGERLPAGGAWKILSNADQIELGPANQGGVLLQFKFSRSKAEKQTGATDSRPTYFDNH